MTSSSAPRTIGLGGAVFTLVGYVVGASIFILPGQLAATAGPGAAVSYVIAGGLAAVACLVGAVIGSAMPVSGSVNVTAARVLSPVLGFLGVWVTLVAVVVSIALVGFGLADYLAYFVPDVDRRLTALAAVIGCGVLNLASVRLAVWVQAAMTLGFLVIMYLFGLGGTLHGNPAFTTPLFPTGAGPVLSGAVLAFFSYAGITVITEIGGEIREPARTIPRALLISFLIVISSYVLVSWAVPALLPWETLGGVAAPVARAAEVFLPGWAGAAISIAALLAAVTSINGMLLIHSRDLLAMARAGLFPVALARRNRAGVPHGAIAVLAVLAVGSVAAGGTIRQYAMMAVMSVMVLQILMGLSLVRLPSRLAAEWGRAGFRLGPAGRPVVAALLIATSLGFFVLGFLDTLAVSGAYLLMVGAGLAYYVARRRWLAARGIDLADVLQRGLSPED